MNLLKKIIKSNRLSYDIALIFYDGRIPFYIHRLFNKPFKFKLINRSKIKLLPQGQVALGVFRKSFEKTEIKIFQKIIKPGMIVVDAGANIGFYSLIASKLTGAKGKVLSFEPSKETYQRLLKNIEINKFSNITSFNIGLGDKQNEKLKLRQDVGCGDAERYLFPANEAPDVKLENIKTVNIEEEIIIDTLDNSLNKFNVKKIDFLKIDTEGFEYYILKGAKQVLKNSPEIVILMECTALGTARVKTTQKEVFRLLKENELNIFYWDSKNNAWSDDELGTLNAGDVWVCKNRKQLYNM